MKKLTPPVKDHADSSMEHKVDLVASLISSLEESQTRHKEAQRIAKLGHWSFDIANNELQWSDEVFRIFEIHNDDSPVSYEGFLQVIHPEDRIRVDQAYKGSLKSGEPYEVEHRLLMADGSIKWVSERCCTEYAHEGLPLRSVGTVHDITERKHAEQLIHRMAHHDDLTDLPNRKMFYDRLGQELSRASRNMESIAILYLDLDGFKAVNDSLGHKVGDALLVEVARRLQTCVRKMDSVARLGGDEFSIILADIKSRFDIERVAQKIIQVMNQPYFIAEKNLYIGASIGIAIYPEHGTTIETLINHADEAMYQVKNSGKNSYLFYSLSDRRSSGLESQK